jgi:glycosyltransferase involved in cell wall biosynthesis
LDLFVSASRSEAFGLAIVEAMACSVAVVASDTDGAREVVHPEETGLLVPVEDDKALAASITRLLNDSRLRARMGQSAFRRAREQFGLKRMVDEVETIYKEALLVP